MNDTPRQNIVQVAQSAGSFSTLITAAQAAGLAGTLSNEGPFTVFAPTDEAFAKLPAGTVEGLLADPDALRDILLYHVASGELDAGKVVSMNSIATLQGGSLDVSTTSGVSVGGAGVVQTDIQASNGIIHIIDTVLIP